MKCLLNVLIVFASVTTLASEDCPYRIEIQGQFVELEQRLVDEWQQKHPAQRIDFDVFSHLRSQSKGKVLFSPHLLTVSGRESVVKAVTFVLLNARVVDSEGNFMQTKHVEIPSPESCISLEKRSRTVIFPKSRGRELIESVCYKVPPDISEYWTPTAADMEGVEEGLPEYLDHVKPAAKDTWSQLYKQVAGVMRGKERFLFISYFFMDLPADAGEGQKKGAAERWASNPYWVYDGGVYYFRVLYDIKRKKFVWFECNGTA